MSVRIKTFLWIVGMLAGGLTAFYLWTFLGGSGESTPTPLTPNPGASSGGWSTAPFPLQLLAYGIGALVVIALLRYIFRGASTSSAFKAGSFWNRIGTSFLVLSALFFMLSKIYPNAPLFNTSEGYGEIAWYFGLAALAALVKANFKGAELFINIIMVVLMFGLLGHRTGELLDPSGKLFANIPFFGSGGGNSGTTRYAFRCDGRESEVIQASSQRVPLVPDTRLASTWVSVLSGQVLLEGPGGWVIQGRSGKIKEDIRIANWEPETITAVTAAQYTKNCLPK